MRYLSILFDCSPSQIQIDELINNLNNINFTLFAEGGDLDLDFEGPENNLDNAIQISNDFINNYNLRANILINTM
jgi:hypothetical protein